MNRCRPDERGRRCAEHGLPLYPDGWCSDWRVFLEEVKGREPCDTGTCELVLGHHGPHGQFDMPISNGYELCSNGGGRSSDHWRGPQCDVRWTTSSPYPSVLVGHRCDLVLGHRGPHRCDLAHDRASRSGCGRGKA